MMASTNSSDFMSLDSLLDGFVSLTADLDITIHRLVMDSRAVQSGDLFIALPGLQVDGRQFIHDAIERGAVAVVWQCDTGTVPIPVSWRPSSSGKKVPVIAIEDLTNKVGVLADRFYHHPSQSMFMVGITGTNGKTSCSHFIAQAIEPYAHCGIVGTLGWGFIDHLLESTHTTPDAVRCHQWLRELAGRGAKATAMEVSSHALDQGRVVGVKFDCAVFTNLTHDHLDYHGDMKSYAAAKRKLFSLKEVRHLIVNTDDTLGKSLAAEHAGRKILRYGLDVENRPDIFATEVSADESGMTFRLCVGEQQAVVHTEIYGLFNVYNLLATAGVMQAMNLSFEQIVERLGTITGIKGRLEIVRVANQPAVIIDYAHTPDALEHALIAVRDHFNTDIWCVVGCGGDRDKQKRPRMAEVAERYARKVVITSDNPRTESPLAIAKDMLQGMQQPESAAVELDRRRAIEYAFEGAQSGGVVLVAGKGHEDYQIIGNEKRPFSDRAVVSSLLGGGVNA